MLLAVAVCNLDLVKATRNESDKVKIFRSLTFCFLSKHVLWKQQVNTASASS